MKVIPLLLLLAAFLFAGCAKSSDVYSSPNFTVDSLVDFSIDANTFYYYRRLHVTYRSGEQAPVKLSIEGLPPGLTCSFSDSTSTPSYATALTVMDSMAALGTYRVYVVADGGINGQVRLPLMITVNPIPECASALQGKAIGSCLCVGANYDDSISKSPDVPNRLFFHNWENGGERAYADLQCANEHVVMPRQTLYGFTYYGEGYYYFDIDGTRKLSTIYSKIHDGITDPCRVYYTF